MQKNIFVDWRVIISDISVNNYYPLYKNICPVMQYYVFYMVLRPHCFFVNSVLLE